MEDDVILLIGKIGAVIMVGFLAFSLWPALAKTNTSAKMTLASDIGLMINTLVSVPGDAQVYYSGNASGFVVSLTNTKVNVFEKGESETKWVNSAFILPEGYRASGLYDGSLPGRLCIEKNVHNIFVGSCADES